MGNEPYVNHELVRKRDLRVLSVFDKFNKLRSGKYTLGKKLTSSGCFSCVYEVTDASGNKLIMKAVDSTITAVDIDPKDIVKYTNAEIASMTKCKDCEYVMDLVDRYDYTFNEKDFDHVYLLLMPKMQVSTAYFEENDYDIDDIVAMAKDICKALDYCHANNILHRDVKPDNIYYFPEKRHFVLSDFGISRSMVDRNAAVTRIGSLVAPEILAFCPLNGRYNSDIYSLGMSMLILNAHMCMTDEIIILATACLNTQLRAAIMKAIEGDPTIRFQTAKEFYQALCAVDSQMTSSKDEDVSVEACVDAFMRKDNWKALEIARKGHEKGSRRMTYLYAYLLTCAGKTDEGLEVLIPGVRKEDPISIGLYGVIGHMKYLELGNKMNDKIAVSNILRAASEGFCVAEYFIGRWMLKGEYELPQDPTAARKLLFDSGKQGFRPSMYYIQQRMKRHPEEAVNVQPFLDLIAIELKDYSENNFPEDMVRVLANC